MIRSLRMRLFLGIVAVSMLVLGILSIAIDQAVHHTLQEEFDATLLDKARALASMVEQSADVTHFDFQSDQFPEFQTGPKAAYFEVYLNGKPYQHSASLGEGHLPPLLNKENAEPEARAFTLPDGRKGRILVMAFVPLIENDDPAARPATQPLPRGLLAVAQDSSGLNHTLGRLRLLFLGLGGAATLLSGALLVGVAGRTIRPLGRLARQIEALRETDLSTVVCARDYPTELVPMVERLNGMLHRLAEAFGRERAFTADVAHELRTPLAGLLATLQVARARPREAAGYEAAIDKSLAMLAQMQGLVENLLLLARADSGQLAVNSQPVALNLLVHECRAAFEEAAARRQVQFQITEQELPRLPADREILRVALHNLLDNAVSYAPAGGTIAIRMLADAPRAVVEIANPCTNLTPEDLPGLFQRFVRKDPSRSATGTHAGLGLSICQRLLALQQGSISLRLEGGQFIARVELPMTPAAAHST